MSTDKSSCDLVLCLTSTRVLSSIFQQYFNSKAYPLHNKCLASAAATTFSQAYLLILALMEGVSLWYVPKFLFLSVASCCASYTSSFAHGIAAGEIVDESDLCGLGWPL